MYLNTDATENIIIYYQSIKELYGQIVSKTYYYLLELIEEYNQYICDLKY